MAYECQAVPATEGRPASIRTVRILKVSIVIHLLPSQGPIKEWNLVDCKDLFPRYRQETQFRSSFSLNLFAGSLATVSKHQQQIMCSRTLHEKVAFFQGQSSAPFLREQSMSMK